MTISTGDEYVITEVQEHADLGWVFFWNSRAFVESGDLSDALGGNGPYLVDRRDGSVHRFGTASSVEKYVKSYTETGDPFAHEVRPPDPRWMPAEERRIVAAEEALGHRFPSGLRERYATNNAGEVMTPGYPTDFPYWTLHPVWDPTSRRSVRKTTNHVVRETESAHEAWGDLLPAGSVVVGSNGTGDLLLLLAGSDEPCWWDHETGQTHPVSTSWQ